MKRFNCGDVVPGCDYEFRGLDHSGIVERAMEHIQARHDVVVDYVLASRIRGSITAV